MRKTMSRDWHGHRTSARWAEVRAGRGRAAGMVLAAIASLALVVPSNAGPAGKTARLSGIKVSESEGDTAVTLAASTRPTFTTWKLERPARVVIDISGVRLGDLDVPFDAGTYAVGSVAASSSDDESGVRTRVVLTLRQAADYK